MPMMRRKWAAASGRLVQRLVAFGLLASRGRAGLLELGSELGLELLESEAASAWSGISMLDADGSAFVCRYGETVAKNARVVRRGGTDPRSRRVGGGAGAE